MSTLEGIREIPVSALHTEVLDLRRQGYRFITLTCTDTETAHDILYHFDLNYRMCHLRVSLPHGETLPSLSDLFFAAVLVENEIKDLFGIPVAGLAVDYKGRFILSEGAPQTPLNRNCGMPVDVRVRTPAGETKGATPA